MSQVPLQELLSRIREAGLQVTPAENLAAIKLAGVESCAEPSALIRRLQLLLAKSERERALVEQTCRAYFLETRSRREVPVVAGVPTVRKWLWPFAAVLLFAAVFSTYWLYLRPQPDPPQPDPPGSEPPTSESPSPGLKAPKQDSETLSTSGRPSPLRSRCPPWRRSGPTERRN